MHGIFPLEKPTVKRFTFGQGQGHIALVRAFGYQANKGVGLANSIGYLCGVRRFRTYTAKTDGYALRNACAEIGVVPSMDRTA